jgi:hypothetical protein
MSIYTDHYLNEKQLKNSYNTLHDPVQNYVVPPFITRYNPPSEIGYSKYTANQTVARANVKEQDEQTRRLRQLRAGLAARNRNNSKNRNNLPPTIAPRASVPVVRTPAFGHS